MVLSIEEHLLQVHSDFPNALYKPPLLLSEYNCRHTRRVQKETELFKYRANQHRERAAATERT
jgi:hypothetical protein